MKILCNQLVLETAKELDNGFGFIIIIIISSSSSSSISSSNNNSSSSNDNLLRPWHKVADDGLFSVEKVALMTLRHISESGFVITVTKPTTK